MPLAAFDIGGTTTRVGVANGSHKTTRQFPTVIDDDRTLGSHVTACLDATLAAASVDASQLAAIGIGLPGSIDYGSGAVRLASNLGIASSAYSLRTEVSSHYGCPVVVENDVKAAAMGLADRLESPQDQILTYLSIGTGIASATVANGQLLRGRQGSAGEVGQMVVAQSERTVHGSLPGSLEAMAAGPTIHQSADGDRQLNHESMLDAARYVALGVHVLFMMFDPHALVIGGGVASNHQFRDHLIDMIDEVRSASSIAEAVIDLDLIDFLDNEETPGLVGASLLASMAAQGSDGRSPSARETGETI